MNNQMSSVDQMNQVSSIFLALFFSLVACVYLVRLTIADKTPDQKKVFAGQRFSSTWWNHMTFRWFRIVIWGVCVCRVIYPDTDRILGLFFIMLSSPVMYAGMTLMVFGFSLALVSHNQLGESWRSGIDPQGPSKLQDKGLYNFSRNPMYIGVIMAQFGFFLTLPSVFTLLCLACGVTAIIRQVFAEEQHLLKQLPIMYRDYSNKVPRWLF